MKSVTMNKRRRKKKENDVVNGKEENRNVWSVTMKEKRMKQNKNNANTLQILKIKTHSRVVWEQRVLFTASTLGPCTVFSLSSSNNYLMSEIHIF
jgi:hypothetical protein